MCKYPHTLTPQSMFTHPVSQSKPLVWFCSTAAVITRRTITSSFYTNTLLNIQNYTSFAQSCVLLYWPTSINYHTNNNHLFHSFIIHTSTMHMCTMWNRCMWVFIIITHPNAFPQNGLNFKSIVCYITRRRLRMILNIDSLNLHCFYCLFTHEFHVYSINIWWFMICINFSFKF